MNNFSDAGTKSSTNIDSPHKPPVTTTSTAATVNGGATDGIPTIQQHFVIAWNLLTKSLLNVFLLGLSSFLLSLVIFGVIWGITVAVGANSFSFSEFIHLLQNKETAAAFELIPASFYMTLAISAVISLIVSGVLQAVFGIATLLAVAHADEKPGVGSLLKAGLQKLGGFIVLSILTFLMVFGSYGVFVIGGIIAGIFFSFSFFELVLHDKKPLAALRASIDVVAENFGTIFVRYVVFILGYLLVFTLVPALLKSLSESLAAIYQVILFIPSLLIGVYSIAYFTVLYKSIRAATPETKTHSGVWMMLILSTVIGWILMFLFGSLLIKLIQAAMDAQLKQQEQAPSMQQLQDQQYMLQQQDFNYSMDDTNVTMPSPTPRTTVKPSTLPSKP